MEHDISPGVERAAASAATRAATDGTSPRLSDWLLALLEEDEGRPWELLVKVGVDPVRLRDEVAQLTEPFAAPNPAGLYSAARKHSIRLRGEPSLTTDMVMLAVLTTDERFTARLSLSVPALEDALRSPLMIAPTAVPPASPPAPVPRAVPKPTEVTPADRLDAGRVVDANLNRARESLRVLDDYARFVRNDAHLSEQLKALRHQLAALSAELPPGLLASRDTPGDVGTAVTAAGEYDRRSPRQVAEVNFKRLQESLRSVEEFGKLFGPTVGKTAEAVRYAAYTLERTALLGGPLREKLAAATLYLLLDGPDMEHLIAESAAGGADIIQLREKSLSDRDLLARAWDVRRWTRQANVLFVMNDRPDLARLAEADGVHLGQDDLPVSAARRIVGPDTLIGVSTHTIGQVRDAIRDGADYIGVGPTFPSTTKEFAHFPGLNFVTEAAQESTVPAFILGGINVRTLPDAIKAGAKRVAVSAAVSKASEPRDVVARLKALLG